MRYTRCTGDRIVPCNIFNLPPPLESSSYFTDNPRNSAKRRTLLLGGGRAATLLCREPDVHAKCYDFVVGKTGVAPVVVTLDFVSRDMERDVDRIIFG